MFVVMKKEQMWRKRINSRRKAQRTKINHLRRQKQSYQVEKYQVVRLIASSQL